MICFLLKTVIIKYAFINVQKPTHEKYRCNYKAFSLKIVQLVIIKDRQCQYIDLKEQEHLKMILYNLYIYFQELLVVIFVLYQV